MDKLCHVSKTVNINMCLYDLVSGRAAHMLAQSPFSSLVFEAVRRVRINFDSASDMASFPTHFDVDTAQNLLKSLKVSNAYVTDIFMDLVMQVPVLNTIQSLSINGTVLSFNSLCSLVESLPQMTQIRFQSIEVYEDYDIPDAIGLYEQIIEKRAVLSTCLKFCQVIHHDPLDTTNDLAICGILLSVMCPRFTRLIVSSTARSRYDSFVRKAIQQEPFSRYAERLSHLIFNDAPKIEESST
ncbi:hypothetical protein GGH94_000206 [Coemansia aciculifera]|uniref:Uncharacterized protein n=1 Tax=Coemansia aciculifera TaxID=417176 RepID=A0A9W8INR6_9FUNG|nr:hypothetical protein GGH94_000206 [Coemansia aciculifera]